MRWCEAKVRSREDLGPIFGTLVGESLLMRTRLRPLRRSTIEFPFAAARSSIVWEYQGQLWLLKSTTLSVSLLWVLMSEVTLGGILVDSRR